MPKPAYQLGPLDPSNERVEEDWVVPTLILNMREAITQTYLMDKDLKRGSPLEVEGSGFLYDFRPQGGPLVYSPNCFRPNLLPPGPPINYRSDSILGGRDYDIAHFLQPQFWSRAQGYFAFLPLTPINTLLSTFSCLRRSPPIRESKSGNQVYPHPVRWCDWTDLQRKVVRACNALGRCAGLPTAYPAWPCARVAVTKYNDESHLELDISSAKEWFRVWLGIMAYEVAALSKMGAEIMALGIPRVIPAWMDILLNPPNAGDEPLDEVFVTDMSQSVCRFDGSITRVGAFVVIPDHYDLEIVSIDWLISLNIPVFWEWTQREVDIANAKPHFKRFEPPADAFDVFGVRQATGPSQSRDMDVDYIPRDQSFHHTSQSHDMDVDQCPQGQNSLAQPDVDSTPRSQTSGQGSQTQPVPPPPGSPHTFSHSTFRRRPDPTDAQLVEWRHSEKLPREAAARLEVLESKKKRALRLAREKNPPTKKGKVTMWVWSLDSGGVYRADKADDMDMAEMFSVESPFSRDQGIYDSFAAAWHIADFLGRPTDEQLEYMALHGSDYYGTPYLLEIKLLRVWYGLDDIPSESPHDMKLRLKAEDAQSEITQKEETGVAVNEVHIHDHADADKDSMNRDVPEDIVPDTVDELSGTRDDLEASAYLLGGYLVPFLDITPEVPPSNEAKTTIGFLLGQRSHVSLGNNSEYWGTHKGRSLGFFADALLDGKAFKKTNVEGSWNIDLNWDVGFFNRHSAQCLQRFQGLKRVRADFEGEFSEWDNVEGLITYSIVQTTRVFMFDNPSEYGWYLGCTSSAVALHICRLNKDMNTTDLARDLLNRGFRFCTFARLSADYPPRHIPLVLDNNPMRYRPSEYEWSKGDYDSWVGAMKTFLRSSRGRAAFLRGGIVWRIAMEFELPDDVIPGPSREARQGMGIVRQDSAKRYYVDDELSAEEIDFMCGVHYVYIKATPKKIRDETSVALSPCPHDIVSQPSPSDNVNAKPVPTLHNPPMPREQIQRMSYFPPEDVWLESYGLFNGWPEDAETKFTNNKADLVSNGFRPKSRAAWKRLLRKPGALGQIAWRLERASDIAITEANQSFDHTL